MRIKNGVDADAVYDSDKALSCLYVGYAASLCELPGPNLVAPSMGGQEFLIPDACGPKADPNSHFIRALSVQWEERSQAGG